MARSIAQALGFPLVNLPAATSDTAIQFLVERLAALGRIPQGCVPQALRQALSMERERSSYLARDVALPRSRCDVAEVVAILGVSAEGIAWPGPTGQRVHTVCLVLAPGRRPGEYLRFLAHTVQVLQAARPSGQTPALRELAARN
jgi:mannitol/fructose-specific phosphotransferase system IIA component (Ntr-type)